jgi:hypothetical protein
LYFKQKVTVNSKRTGLQKNEIYVREVMKLNKKMFAEKIFWMLNVGSNISISILRPRKEHSLIDFSTPPTLTVISF